MAATEAPARVLVVDDEPNIRDFLQLGLQYEGFEVALAGDRNTALRMMREFRPDLVVLDVMLPGMDGWAVGQALRSNPEVLIIYLTARDEVADRVRGLELGADDYMVKPFSFQELVARIRLRLRKQGGRGPADSKRRVGDLILDEATREVWYQDTAVSLSPREFDLLRTLVLHAGQVLSKQQLLDLVWGHDYFGDDNVVEVYIRYLREKLGDREDGAGIPRPRPSRMPTFRSLAASAGWWWSCWWGSRFVIRRVPCAFWRG